MLVLLHAYVENIFRNVNPVVPIQPVTSSNGPMSTQRFARLGVPLVEQKKGIFTSFTHSLSANLANLTCSNITQRHSST